MTLKLGDKFKNTLAAAAIASGLIANPVPAHAMGYHMSGMGMPPEVASGMVKQMCTDKVMMDNSMMSKDSCKALKKGDMKLAMEHMNKKEQSLTTVQKETM